MKEGGRAAKVFQQKGFNSGQIAQQNNRKSFKFHNWQFKIHDGPTGVLNSRGATLLVIRTEPSYAVFRDTFLQCRAT